MKPYSKNQSIISAKTYREEYMNKTRKKKKYRNKSQIYTSSLYGTRRFDSIKEANYCEELDWLLEAGEIVHYDLQPKIPIRGLQGIETGVSYFVDFRVKDKYGQVSYREVKSDGTMTALWRLKWVLCLQQIAIDEPGTEMIIIK